MEAPPPASLLRLELEGGDAAARERALCTLCRAQASGLDVSDVVAACLPRLVTSDALLSPDARRLAVDLLRHAVLTEAQWAPLAAAAVALISSEAREVDAGAFVRRWKLTRPHTRVTQAEPAPLRYALLCLCDGFPPLVAVSALRGLPGLGAGCPSVRCAAATALARHLREGHLAGALDVHSLRRLVTACGDSFPEASGAAFAALAALFDASGLAPSAPQAAAAAQAAQEVWTVRKELLARAQALPPHVQLAALSPLAFALLGVARGSLAPLRSAGGLAPMPLPPSGDVAGALEGLAELLSSACEQTEEHPALALEAAEHLLRVAEVTGAPDDWAKDACTALLSLSSDAPRAPVTRPLGDSDQPQPPAQPLSSPLRFAALRLLSAAAPRLPLAIAPVAVRTASKHAACLHPRTLRAAAFAHLACSSLALACRPDARAAARGGVLRSLWGDALGALHSQDPAALEELLASLLLAAAGDAAAAHPAHRGPAWPLVALETAELCLGGASVAFPGGSSLAAAALLALLARLAPVAHQVRGEAQQRTQAALRGAFRGVLATHAQGGGCAAPELCGHALALLAHHAEPLDAQCARAFADGCGVALQGLLRRLEGCEREATQAAAADGQLASAAAAVAAPASPQAMAAQAALARALGACQALLARCGGGCCCGGGGGGGVSRADVAHALRNALRPLGDAPAARAALSPHAEDAFAALQADLARAGEESGDPADPKAQPPQPPQPPATLPSPAFFLPTGGTPSDAALRRTLLAALAEAGLPPDDGEASWERSPLGCSPPPHPPRPHAHPPVLLTAASDPLWVRMSHSCAPGSRRVELRLQVGAHDASATRGLLLSLHLALSGPLAPWAGAPALGATPLTLLHPSADHEGAASAQPRAERCFQLELCAFGAAEVHVRIQMAQGAGATGVLRCQPYRLPFTDLLVPAPLSAAAFHALWPTLPCAACVLGRPSPQGASSAPASPSAAAPPSLPPPKSTLAALVGALEGCPVSRVLACTVAGAPGLGRAAYAARTWTGELLLLLASSEGEGGAHLETRSAQAHVAQALADNLHQWLYDLCGGACTLVTQQEQEEAPAVTEEAPEGEEEYADDEAATQTHQAPAAPSGWASAIEDAWCV